MFAAAGWASFASVSVGARGTSLARATRCASVARWTSSARGSVVAGFAGFARSARGTRLASSAGLTSRSLLTGNQFAGFASGADSTRIAVGTRRTSWAGWSLRSGLTIAAGATCITGWSIGALGTNGSSWAGLGHAFALRWNGQQFLFFAGVLSWASLLSVLARLAVTTIFAGFASWAGWTTLAGTAGANFAASLPLGHTHESAERCLRAFSGAAAVSLMDVQHFFPHVTGA